MPGEPAPPIPDKPPVILHHMPKPEAGATSPPKEQTKAEESSAERAKPHKRVRHKRKHKTDD
jgi:hypothetical protein